MGQCLLRETLERLPAAARYGSVRLDRPERTGSGRDLDRAGEVSGSAVPHGRGVWRADFERGLETKIAQILPYDPKTAGAASNAGRPIVVAAKNSALAKAMRKVCTAMAGTEKAERPKTSLGLFRRK